MQEVRAWRKDLNAQLDRLQELYVLGDVSKERYTWRRQAIEEELQRIEPPVRLDFARAEQVLGDFGRFWEAESDPFERRKLIASLFDNVWQDDGRIVAVKPRPAFAAYFKAVSETRNGQGGDKQSSKTAADARYVLRERREADARSAPPIEVRPGRAERTLPRGYHWSVATAAKRL